LEKKHVEFPGLLGDCHKGKGGLDAVPLVLASAPYDGEDDIHDGEQFLVAVDYRC
jgi:hypothetical protein